MAARSALSFEEGDDVDWGGVFSRKRDCGHHPGTTPCRPEAMGAISQAVHNVACASQARLNAEVKRRSVRSALGDGGLEPGEEAARAAIAEGEKLGILRKWRRARCVMV